MKRFLPLLLLAGAVPVFAQSVAPVSAPPASSVEWGTQAASAPAAAPAPKPPPSAFAAARASTQATGDYFHDFGELIVRVRSVKWIEEICSEAFPATAETNQHAYEVWLADHGAFVDEIEGQFQVIAKYWGDASDAAKKEGLTVDQLKARVDANRPGLRQDFRARSPRAFQARCEAYPEILLSPQLDLENSQAELVRSVRLGPGSR
jgi:hypothetical protein